MTTKQATAFSSSFSGKLRSTPPTYSSPFKDTGSNVNRLSSSINFVRNSSCSLYLRKKKKGEMSLLCYCLLFFFSFFLTIAISLFEAWKDLNHTLCLKKKKK